MPALTPTLGYGVGAAEDNFGLTVLNAGLKLVASKKTPHAKSAAKAQDEGGNEIAETKYGTDTIFDVECSYDLISGTLDTATLALGLIAAGAEGVAPLYAVVVSNISGKTSNGAWPQITVKGAMNAAGIATLFTDLPTFTCPSFTLTAKKTAQLLGFTLATGAKQTGTGFSFDGSLTWHTETGTTLAGALTGAELKATAEAVEVTAAVVFTAVSPFASSDQVQKAGRDAKPTAYGTGSAEATKTYPPDSEA
jgi:hypothetical protein